ncbi:TRAP-type C4-dicarboxylate transport system, substrate-binding protein [Desulfonatronum thiosulfatophilum]|uniref:TRAP-type C4-dicarboxylate transport system, substrate-binding protein n=1 Tax=Desulfonatronum thiosulfatophilum TaxID=617002 RepID=A0A1G6DY18_9BACT|nr:TRAP transporter substrate-binding protein [Desulfonatronum thiosulfatophilum]SDB50087.1 TRAP-type C4-dicarboxylate transport system, substrate-binding protein [Desulfonatronum thiosulfatophilum]
MMNRIGVTILALLMTLVMSAGSAGASGKTVTLRLAHFFPATHPAETVMVQGWAQALAEASDGRIKIVSFPGQTLLAASEVYDGVVTGIADIGLSAFAYTRGRFPLLEVFELPGVTYENSKVASQVAWEAIKELNPTEVRDTKLLMVLATGPGDLFTKSPVRTLEDLQGMEIRATGLSAKTLSVLGAIPVAMPQSEAYEALSRGLVKGNLSPLEVLQGWRHAEVTEYLTLTPFLYNTLFFVTMNQRTWNSLPADLQAVVEEVSERFFQDVAMGLWDTQNEAALKYAVEDTGQQVVTLSDEETARWTELVLPIQVEFVEEMRKKGLPGQQALDLVQELSEKYNALY